MSTSVGSCACSPLSPPPQRLDPNGVLAQTDQPGRFEMSRVPGGGFVVGVANVRHRTGPSKCTLAGGKSTDIGKLIVSMLST